jgi:hypothetical protein
MEGFLAFRCCGFVAKSSPSLLVRITRVNVD